MGMIRRLTDGTFEARIRNKDRKKGYGWYTMRFLHVQDAIEWFIRWGVKDFYVGV